MSGWDIVRLVVGIAAVIVGALCWSAFFALGTPAYQRKMVEEIRKEFPYATDEEIQEFKKFLRLFLSMLGGASIAVFLLMCLARS